MPRPPLPSAGAAAGCAAPAALVRRSCPGEAGHAVAPGVRLGHRSAADARSGHAFTPRESWLSRLPVETWLVGLSWGAARSIVKAGQTRLAKAPRRLSPKGRAKRLWSALERWLRDAGDRPDKADHLTSDRGGNHDFGPARRSQSAIARVQPDLPFPGISRTAGDSFSLPSCSLRLTRACIRYVQAPSISTRRARALPALVMPPRLMVAPDECSEGTRPK